MICSLYHSCMWEWSTCKRAFWYAKFGDQYGRMEIWLTLAIAVNEIDVDDDEIAVNHIKTHKMHRLRFVVWNPIWYSSDVSVVKYRIWFCNCITNICLNISINTVLTHWLALNFLVQIHSQATHSRNNSNTLRKFVKIELSNFAVWFPNAHHLEIVHCTADETRSFDGYFPQLKHLTFNYPWIDFMPFNLECTAHLLRANPHLQSLQIFTIEALTMTNVLDAIALNPNITNLKINRFVKWNC